MEPGLITNMTYLDVELTLLHEHIRAAVHPLHGDLALLVHGDIPLIMQVPEDLDPLPGTALALVTVTTGYLDIPLVCGDIQGGAN